MATKQEFIDEITTQITAAQEASAHLKETVVQCQSTLTMTREGRKDLIQKHALRLLPNLGDEALAELANSVPDFISRAQVDDLIETAKETYHRQIDRLLLEFDPGKYSATRLQLERDRERLGDNMRRSSDWRAEELRRIPNFGFLMSEKYGTDEYRIRPWQLRYYTDWSKADDAVAASGKKDWNALVKDYEDNERNIDSLKLRAEKVSKQISDLDAAQASHVDLIEAQAKVPDTVLEQLRVKLTARLETMLPVPEWMSDVVLLNDRLAELEKRNLDIQNASVRMAEELSKLIGIRAQAQRSKKRDVPDTYVQTMRSRRSNGGGGGSASVYTNVIQNNYYNDDSYFLNMLLFEEMNGFFDQPAPAYVPAPTYVPSYNAGPTSAADDRREQAYAEAHADNSTQS